MNAGQVKGYFDPDGPDRFWLWTPEGDAVTWDDGATIAFFQEIDLVLGALRPHGLPRFEPLVLVLAACRQNWEEPGTGGRARLVAYVGSLGAEPVRKALPDVAPNWVERLLNGLTEVHRHYAADPTLGSKVTVCEKVFENAGDHLDASRAAAAVEAFSAGQVNALLGRERDGEADLRTDAEGRHVVLAPVAGTYWNAEKPGGAALLRPGQRFGEGSLLASFEADEVLHEIRAGRAGRVVDLLLNSGDYTMAGTPVLRYLPEREPTRAFAQTVRDLLGALPSLAGLESVSLRKATGFDELPEAAGEDGLEDLPEPVRSRRLIDALAADDDAALGGIARVARDLLGTLLLPRHPADPDDVPRGGFSDIASRGNLDRLLLSELAQDDDVLAVRVALNEALYLRREKPPQRQPRGRLIYIDTGVRSWGLPRAIAHAAALALQAGADPGDEVSAWSSDAANPAAAVACQLSTREGLVEQLGRLSPAHHPAAAVASVLELAGAEAATEVVIITHPRVMEEEAFQRALGRSDGGVGDSAYILSVDGSGACTLWQSRAGGQKKEIKRIQVDPARLRGAGREKNTAVKRPEAVAKLHRENVDPAWPEILKLTEFPLRVAHPVPCRRVLIHPERGVFAVTRHRALLHWDDPARGARVLGDELAPGAIHFLGIEETHEQLVVLKQHLRLVRLTVINLPDGRVSARPALFKTPDHAFLADHHLVTAAGREIVARRLTDGEPAFRRTLSGKAIATTGRFVRARVPGSASGEGWFAVSVGHDLAVRSVVCPAGDQIAGIVEHRDRFSNPLTVLRSGAVIELDDPPRRRLTIEQASQLACVTLIPGRPELFIAHETYGGSYLVDLEKKSWLPDFPDPQRLPVERLRSNQRKVFTRASAVVITPEGIGLPLGAGVREVRNAMDALVLEGDSLALATQVYYPATVRHVPLEPCQRHPPGFRLRRADLGNGVTAWLDSRGILHLCRKGDPPVEISLVLCVDRPVSGWIGDGRFFGDTYYSRHGDATATGAEAYAIVMDLVRSAGRARRPASLGD